MASNQDDVKPPLPKTDNLSKKAVAAKLGVTASTIVRWVKTHGFRSSFRDWAGENGDYAHNVIEFSLAHQLDGKTEGAYLRSELLEKRRTLMQDWADFVTSKVIA